MVSFIKLAGCGLLFVALIFAIVTTASNEWWKTEVGNAKASYGLWKACAGSVCAKYDDLSSWMEAVRAMEVLSVLVLIAVLVVGVLVSVDAEKLPQILTDNAKLLQRVLIAGIVVAAITTLLSLAIFAGKYESSEKNPLTDLSWGFAMVPVRLVLLIIAAIVFFVGFSKEG